MTTEHRPFCKEFQCFDTMACRHIPYLCTSELPLSPLLMQSPSSAALQSARLSANGEAAAAAAAAVAAAVRADAAAVAAVPLLSPLPLLLDCF